MTKQELDKIFELARTLDPEFEPDDIDVYEEQVSDPIYNAIKNNDQTVIEYLENSSKEVRYKIATTIEDALVENNIINEGVVSFGYDRAFNLLRSIYEENGLNADEIINEG